MMNFSDIRETVRDMYATRYEPEGVRVLADIYWKSLLATACLVAVLAFVWGVFDLFGVLDTLAAAPDTSPTPAAAFNRGTLKNLVQEFQDHQSQFNALGAEPLPSISDPSK